MRKQGIITKEQILAEDEKRLLEAADRILWMKKNGISQETIKKEAELFSISKKYYDALKMDVEGKSGK